MSDGQSTAQDEFKEAGVYSDHETNRGKLICCAQLKEPVPIVCIKAKHTEAKRHGEEKLSTLQQSLKKHNAECAESNFTDKHEKCSEKSWNLANVKKPISRAIQYQGTFSDNHFCQC
jgi:hypothetical protein